MSKEKGLLRRSGNHGLLFSGSVVKMKMCLALKINYNCVERAAGKSKDKIIIYNF